MVRAELVRRHADLLDAVADVPDGRVLDLSLPAGRSLLAEVLAEPPVPVSVGESPVPSGERPARVGGFDAVISVAGFTRFPDLGAALSAAVRLLSPTGHLLAVEPDHRPGVGGLAVSSLGALLPPVRGVHLARDVPGTVRSVGLTVTDIRRLTLATPVWPLRRFVDLRAARIGAVDPSSAELAPSGGRRGEDDGHEDRNTGGVR